MGGGGSLGRGVVTVPRPDTGHARHGGRCNTRFCGLERFCRRPPQPSQAFPGRGGGVVGVGVLLGGYTHSARLLVTGDLGPLRS